MERIPWLRLSGAQQASVLAALEGTFFRRLVLANCPGVSERESGQVACFTGLSVVADRPKPGADTEAMQAFAIA